MPLRLASSGLHFPETGTTALLTLPDPETVALGAEMAAQQKELRSQIGAAQCRETKARKSARDLGMNLSPGAAHRPETAPALDRLTQLLNEVEEYS